MNLKEDILTAHFASCGCEGITCYACGRHFAKGDRYYLLGATHLCKLCAGAAVAEWLHFLLVAEGPAHSVVSRW